MPVRNLFKALRIHHYLKNVFVLMPLFCGGKITDPALFSKTMAAFAAFSLSASAVYLLNDYVDAAQDRLHPRKKIRPIASGALSGRTALILMGVLTVGGVSLMGMLPGKGLLVLAGYLALNLLYIFWLKRIVILDVIVIAIGFVLRLLAGASVSDIPLSLWIISMTFLLALFLALAKRREDVLIFLETGTRMRHGIDGYSLRVLDHAVIIMGLVVIVTYILYSMSPPVLERIGTNSLYVTALFVILGVLRYLKLTLVKGKSGSPIRIIVKDRLMQLAIAGWVLSFGGFLYL